MEKLAELILVILLAFHSASAKASSLSLCRNPSVTGIQVENVLFPPYVKPPGSILKLFLGGAGVRGLDMGGQFVKFTAIGVYLEGSAVPTLAGKWKGKTVEELTASVDFFSDVYSGPFEKFTDVTFILQLTGPEYSEKVAENCVAFMKSQGTYTDAEAKAIDEFLKVFKDQVFPPGASVLFTHSPRGALTISFSQDGSIPKVGTAVIKNKPLTEAILESIIGKDGVSPAAKMSLAARLSELFKK